jgi:predicted O-linked N-acetylglucosamine transferase (SPINDLY family)
MCEWDDFALSAARLRALLAEGRSGRISPFQLLSVPGISAREHRGCSELWVRDRVAASILDRDKLAFEFDLTSREKLRIGYFSNDFHNHATSQLLVETFEAHDRERCELHAFSC